MTEVLEKTTFREATGDILSYPAQAIVIPTNMQYKMRTKKVAVAIMGAGLAKAAAKKWPRLPEHLGKSLQIQNEYQSFATSPYCYWEPDTDEPVVACLPTKHHYRDDSSLGLISVMLDGLVGLADANGWTEVAVPRLGCGLGNRDWITEVKPLMESKLDSRFVVVTKGC